MSEDGEQRGGEMLCRKGRRQERGERKNVRDRKAKLPKRKTGVGTAEKKKDY